MSRQKDVKAGAKCTICGKKASKKYHPFCSKRCADIDLHRWLGEGYRMPTDEPGIVPDIDIDSGY